MIVTTDGNQNNYAKKHQKCDRIFCEFIWFLSNKKWFRNSNTTRSIGWLQDDLFLANIFVTLVYVTVSFVRTYYLRRSFVKLGFDDNFIKLDAKLVQKLGCKKHG